MSFREVRHASATFGAVVVGSGVLVTANLLVSAWPAAASDAERVFLVVVSVLTLGLCAAVGRMTSVVEVRADGVYLAFRLGITAWRRHISWDELVVDGVRDVGVVRAGGLGLRFLGNGHVALMTRTGPGVVLEVPARRRTYVVGSDRTDSLLAALAAHGATGTDASTGTAKRSGRLTEGVEDGLALRDDGWSGAPVPPMRLARAR